MTDKILLVILIINVVSLIVKCIYLSDIRVYLSKITEELKYERETYLKSIDYNTSEISNAIHKRNITVNEKLEAIIKLIRKQNKNK
jgi:hypothetical protein